MSFRKYALSCHCRDVQAEVDADLDTEPVQECNCSICTRKGILHLIVSRERFRLLTPEDKLSTYTFGTHQAKHLFCKRCGMHPFYIPRSHPDHIDVNVRCLEGVELGNVRRLPFDGRNWEQSIGEFNPAWEKPTEPQ